MRAKSKDSGGEVNAFFYTFVSKETDEGKY